MSSEIYIERLRDLRDLPFEVALDAANGKVAVNQCGLFRIAGLGLALRNTIPTPGMPAA